MKLRLSIGQKPWSGYFNIDPSPDIEADKREAFTTYIGDVRNIDGVIEDAECTEIMVDDVIDYIPVGEVIDVINVWIRKLRHKGRIIIISTNLDTVVNAYINGEITALDFNWIIFGKNEHVWDNKSCCISLEDVDDILRRGGLTILEKQLVDFNFNIIAQRP